MFHLKLPQDFGSRLGFTVADVHVPRYELDAMGVTGATGVEDVVVVGVGEGASVFELDR